MGLRHSGWQCGWNTRTVGEERAYSSGLCMVERCPFRVRMNEHNSGVFVCLFVLSSEARMSGDLKPRF